MLFSLIRRKLPYSLKIKIVYKWIWIKGVLDFGNKYCCNICNKSATSFSEFNGHSNRLCPRCFSLERHRLLYEYLKEKTNLLRTANTLLHFAPEKCIHNKLRENDALQYETADLMAHFIELIEVKPKHIASVTDIPFPSNYFDAVICNHVLEHVDDDDKAMKEIFRVTRPGGFAILQVPINYESEITLEDRSLSRDERRAQYGSPDHLRYYSEPDYIAKLENAGFGVIADEFVGNLDYSKNIMDRREKIFRCEKACS